MPPNLTELLPLEQIIPELQAHNKKAVLEELCGPVLARWPAIDSNALMGILQEREKLGSTGIGDGVAIPHGKLAELQELMLVFGRSRSGVDFDALDGKPAYLFFLVLAPENSAGVHLKALAHISRLLKSQNVRQELMQARDASQISEVIKAQDMG